MTNPLEYMAIPFKWGGRNFDGCDCYGIVKLWFQQVLNIRLTDYIYNSNHEDELDYDYLVNNTDNDFVEIPFSNIKMHDVILFKNSNNEPKHVGVMINDTACMQITRKFGVIIHNLNKLPNKVYKCYRHRSLA